MRILSGQRHIKWHLTNYRKRCSLISAWHFDKEKETYVTVDASPVGVSAILAQKTKDKNDEKVVAYASRALTDVEEILANRERSALLFGEWNTSICTYTGMTLYS